MEQERNDTRRERQRPKGSDTNWEGNDQNEMETDFAVERFGDGARDARLADAGRTVKAEDLALCALLQLADGDELCRRQWDR